MYAEIDRNSLFVNRINPEDRSKMNACFRMQSEALELQFITYCELHNITGIKGHKVTGGLRVSMYNAQSLQHVTALINVMQEFESTFINK